MQQLKRLARAFPLAALALACLASAVRASCPPSFSYTFNNGKTWTIAYVNGSYDHDKGTGRTTICYDLSSPNGGTTISHFVLGACPDLQNALVAVRFSDDGGVTFEDATSALTGGGADPKTGVQGIKLDPGPAGRYCFIFEGCWRFSEDVPNLDPARCPVVGLKDASNTNVRGTIIGLMCEECPSQPELTITCPSVKDLCSTHKVGGTPGARVGFDDPLTAGGVPPISLVCTAAMAKVQSGDFFPEGTTTVTCTASDSAGQTATCSFSVTVDRGTQLDVEAEAIPGQPAVVCATLTDLCGSPVAGETVRFQVQANNQTYNGSGTTDSNGKAVMHSPPTIMQPGGTNITVSASYGGQTPVEGQAEYCATSIEEEIDVADIPIGLTCPTVPDTCSTDEVDGIPGAYVTFDPPIIDGGVGPYDIVCTPASGSFFPEGTTIVMCSVTDSLGQTQTCNFNVTVDRATELSVTAVAQYSDRALIEATLTDICGNPIAGKQIDFTVNANGQAYTGSAMTDVNGAAAMPNPPMITQAAGTGFSVQAGYAGEAAVEGVKNLCGAETEADPTVECEDAILSNLRCQPSVKSGGNITINLQVDVDEFSDGSPGDLTTGNTVVAWELCTLDGQVAAMGSAPIATVGDPATGTATIQTTIPYGLYIIKVQVGGSYYCSEVLDANPNDDYTGSPVDADPPKGDVLSTSGTGTAVNTAFSAGPYVTKVATVQVCDNTANANLLGSGLCKITVIRANNCLLYFDHPGGTYDGAQGYSVGGCYLPAPGTAVVMVTAIRINPGKSASFLLEGEDCFCNLNTVDPVYDTLLLGKSGYATARYSRRMTGDAILGSDTYVSFTNHSGSAIAVRITVNSRWKLEVVVPAGQTYHGTLQALKPGEDNRIQVLAQGPPGGRLDLAIADVPPNP